MKKLGMALMVTAAAVGMGAGVAHADGTPSEPTPRQACLLDLMLYNGNWEMLSPECKVILSAPEERV